MRFIYLCYCFFLCCIFIQCKQEHQQNNDTLNHTIQTAPEAIENKLPFDIHPIQHASIILQGKEHTIYVDPVGDFNQYRSYPIPDIILITDLHEDHLAIETLDSVIATTTKIITPAAVAEQLPAAYTDQLIILNNNEHIDLKSDTITIQAIPMYNLREEAVQFRKKGRGNGYVITIEDTRVYISGSTEDIPEMRNLRDIDVAFICMNLPWTMAIDQAAEAVLAFNPKYVYPYHYKGKEGLSDLDTFKTLVTSKNHEIEIVVLDWYPKHQK